MSTIVNCKLSNFVKIVKKLIILNLLLILTYSLCSSSCPPSLPSLSFPCHCWNKHKETEMTQTEWGYRSSLRQLAWQWQFFQFHSQPNNSVTTSATSTMQQTKHRKSAKLPWHHNIKLSFWLLSFHHLVFLSSRILFYFFVFF